MFELCRECGLEAPEIAVLGQSVRVTLYRRSHQSWSLTSASINESVVLKSFRDNPTMTISDLCKSTILTKHDAEVTIKSLKDKGILKRVGARKRGMWLIDEEIFKEWDEE